MKSLLTLFVLFFSSSVVADEQFLKCTRLDNGFDANAKPWKIDFIFSLDVENNKLFYFSGDGEIIKQYKEVVINESKIVFGDKLKWLFAINRYDLSFEAYRYVEQLDPKNTPFQPMSLGLGSCEKIKNLPKKLL